MALTCLNLVASESPTNPTVRQLLAIDLGRRYWVGAVYGGGEYLGQILDLTRQLAADLFQAGYVRCPIVRSSSCDRRVAVIAPRDAGSAGPLTVRSSSWSA
jgi:glycine/serine hydroxymethyltransferase